MSIFTNIRTFSHERFFRIAAGASFAMFAVGIFLIVWQLFPKVISEHVVPLHYNIHFGVDEVGPWWRLFLPSAIALVLSIGNMLYAGRVWQRERVIAHAFMVTTLLVHLFVLLHVIFIVLLNISYA